MNKGYLNMLFPENYVKRSQDVEPIFFDAGQFYWMKMRSFLLQKKLFAEKTVGIEISPLESQDLDNEDDWKIAELKYQLLKDRRET